MDAVTGTAGGENMEKVSGNKQKENGTEGQDGFYPISEDVEADDLPF